MNDGNNACSQKTDIQVPGYFEYEFTVPVTPSFVHIASCDGGGQYYPKVVQPQYYDESKAEWIDVARIETNMAVNASEYVQNSRYYAIVQQCPAESYDKMGCGCTTCRRCPKEAYRVSGCTSDVDSVCSPCLQCNTGQFQIHDCGDTQNRACKDCTVCNSTTEFEIAGCSRKSDRVCRPCTTCKPGHQKIAAACSEKADTQCSECTVCENGQRRVGSCSSTGNDDYTCLACTQCGPGQFTVGQCQPDSTVDFSCTTCGTCLPQQEYQVAPCAGKRDVQCAQCASVCTSGVTWESQPCNHTKNQNRVCSKCSKCGAGTYETGACTLYADRNCQACSACPPGKVKVGGCDGTLDTICGLPDDFVGTVSTGKPGATNGCMCDSASVGNDFMSRSAWFFRFRDNNQSDVFASSSTIDGPCKEEACDMTAPLGDRIGFSNGQLPSSVEITGTGCDGWCMSRICVASSQLGKRYVWSGMQWMNPCGGGSNTVGATTGTNSTEPDGTVEPCEGVAWPAVPLTEEPYGDCSVAVQNTDDTRWNEAWTAAIPTTNTTTNASSTATNANTATNSSNSTVTIMNTDTSTTTGGNDACGTCSARGTGFYVVGCGNCEDEDGVTPRRYLADGMTQVNCQSKCQGDSSCSAWEFDDTGAQSCYVYYESGTPGRGWVEETSTGTKVVSKASSSGGYTSGCTIRGAVPASCGGTTTTTTTTTTGGTSCTVGEVIGDFTTLGCGRCQEATNSQTPDTGARRFYSTTDSATCASTCSGDTNCQAYEHGCYVASQNTDDAGGGVADTCCVYYESGSPGTTWSTESDEGGVVCQTSQTNQNAGNAPCMLRSILNTETARVTRCSPARFLGEVNALLS